MCEITILNAEKADPTNADAFVEVAKTLYDSNPHGLGILAVRPGSFDGVERDVGFTYRWFKAGWGGKTETVPPWDSAEEWISDQLGDDSVWRLVFHARYATHGEKGQDETHPILTSNVDVVDWTGVIHNGVVNTRRRMTDYDEDDFNTGVDSELIPHAIPAPSDSEFDPESDDEWDRDRLRGSMNVILFNSHQILVRSDGKYGVTDDFTMACPHRDWWRYNEDDGGDTGFDHNAGWFRLTPDLNVERRDLHRERSTAPFNGNQTTVNTVSTRGVQSAWGRYGYTGYSGNDDEDDETDENRTHKYDGYSNRSQVVPTNIETNPLIGSDEGTDEHPGYVIIEDGERFVCKRHGTINENLCAQCGAFFRGREGVTADDVRVTQWPDRIQTSTATVTVDPPGTDVKEDVVLNRCPHNQQVFYATDECPKCEVPHKRGHGQPEDSNLVGYW